MPRAGKTGRIMAGESKSRSRLIPTPTCCPSPTILGDCGTHTPKDHDAHSISDDSGSIAGGSDSDGDDNGTNRIPKGLAKAKVVITDRLAQAGVNVEHPEIRAMILVRCWLGSLI